MLLLLLLLLLFGWEAFSWVRGPCSRSLGGLMASWREGFGPTCKKTQQVQEGSYWALFGAEMKCPLHYQSPARALKVGMRNRVSEAWTSFLLAIACGVV